MNGSYVKHFGPIERELMALKVIKGKRRERWKGRKGVPGKLQVIWQIRAPLERVLVEGRGHESERRRTLEPTGEEKGRMDRDSIRTVNRSTVDRGRVAVQDGKQRKDIGTTQQKDALGEVEKGRGCTDKDGTYWFDEASAQGADMTGGGEWHGVSSNQWPPKLFLVESTTPGRELKNSFWST